MHSYPMAHFFASEEQAAVNVSVKKQLLLLPEMWTAEPLEGLGL